MSASPIQAVGRRRLWVGFAPRKRAPMRILIGGSTFFTSAQGDDMDDDSAIIDAALGQLWRQQFFQEMPISRVEILTDILKRAGISEASIAAAIEEERGRRPQPDASEDV
jgi:hypothetical protein